jgi:hypothetical protein
VHFATISADVHIAGSTPVERQCHESHQTACPIGYKALPIYWQCPTRLESNIADVSAVFDKAVFEKNAVQHCRYIGTVWQPTADISSVPI